ncbi:MAG: L,D-transpeptidase family protein [Eggerthellaceae bacterium]|nr:L,D-transpeptidase family protein [Eggerthellaceae bacterium]
MAKHTGMHGKKKAESSKATPAATSKAKAAKAAGSHARAASPIAAPAKDAAAPKSAKAAPKPGKAAAASKGSSAKAAAPAAPAAPKAAREVSMKEADRRRNGLKVFGITVGSAVGVAAVVYLVGVAVFANLFFPNTVIAGTDISLKTSDDVHAVLEEKVADYEFTVTGQGLDLELTSQQAGMSLDGRTIAQEMHSRVDPWRWPLELFEDHDETASLVASYQTTELADALAAAAAEVNATAEPPVSATVAFDEARGAFVVVPEQYGTAIDPDKLVDEVSAQAAVLKPRIEVSADVLAQPEVVRGDPLLDEALAQANALIAADFDLTMNGIVGASVTPSLVASWVVVGPDLSITLDDEALSAWAKEVAATNSTIGTTRSFTRADGKAVTVSGGDYGWRVDADGLVTAVRDAVSAGQQGAVEMPLKNSAAAWNGAGAPDWGLRRAEVDLSQQHAWLYGDDGSVIWESDVVTGNPTQNNATPTGVFYIKSNAGASELIGLKPDGTEDYRTPVDYWMPFKGNSIGFHDAGWQSSFGGNRYTYAGSHGCVNLPPAKAKELHELLKVGDPVIVYS